MGSVAHRVKSGNQSLPAVTAYERCAHSRSRTTRKATRDHSSCSESQQWEAVVLVRLKDLATSWKHFPATRCRTRRRATRMVSTGDNHRGRTVWPGFDRANVDGGLLSMRSTAESLQSIRSRRCG